MRTTILFLLFLVQMGNLNAKNSITAQYPDKITYNGNEYSLNSNPLEPYFEKNPDVRPEMGSTALWRGYVAHFEIIDNQLYVTDITRPIRFVDEDGNQNQEWVSIYRKIFPTSEKVKIDLYTGILILPHGEMIESVHMGYASTYSKYVLLEIDKGNFKEGRNYTNKEFVGFKQRQFEIFMDTDEYKTLFANLKEKDNFGNSDDNYIKSFLADYVIEYTSKFFTD